MRLNVGFGGLARPSASICIALVMLGQAIQTHADDGPETTVTKEQRLEWFRQAKFGMFIHWGPYAKMAGQWRGKQLPVGDNCEWIMQRLRIPREEYREAAKQFNPVKFDADAWADLAATTGMKYVVLTAKHHDGFAMYHSRVSKYNIVDHTPFDRDPLRELAVACRKRGLKFCIYYSHREDWDEPFAYGNTWDFDFKPEDNLSLFEEKYLETKAKPQLEELLTNYGPFGLVWFDRGMYTPQQGRAFAELVWKHQPYCLVNGRVGNYEQELLGDYQNMNDNGMPIGGIEESWETPQTLNETWGYSDFDHEWKNPEEVIRRLVEIVSRGGNYLLNIGPDGEGVVPGPSVEILQAVGRWVSANGESIYGTTVSPFHELPWGYCTTKETTLYLHVFDWPGDRRLRLHGLHTAARSASLLTNPAKRLPIRQEDGCLEITVPDEPSDPVNTVIVVNLAGTPRVDPPVVSQASDGTIALDYIRAITGGSAVKRFNRKGKFHISKWTTPEDTIVWHVDVVTPGRFKVKITYAANTEWSGQPYVVQVGQTELEAAVQPTGKPYEYKTFSLGTVEIKQPGHHQLLIRPAKKLDNDLMYFRALELVPVELESSQE